MNRRRFLGLIAGAAVAPISWPTHSSTPSLAIAESSASPRRFLYRVSADGKTHSLIGEVPAGATGYSTGGGGRWLFPER